MGKLCWRSFVKPFFILFHFSKFLFYICYSLIVCNQRLPPYWLLLLYPFEGGGRGGAIPGGRGGALEENPGGPSIPGGASMPGGASIIMPGGPYPKGIPGGGALPKPGGGYPLGPLFGSGGALPLP